MGTKTDGCKALNDWLAGGPARISQGYLADRLRISQGSVSLWCRGVSRPEHHHRLALEHVCGIDPMAWLTPAEARSLAAVRRVA